MSVNPKRRQRKLEKKRAERKSDKKEIARRQSQGVFARFREAGAGPVLHCEYSPSIWSEGLGQVWVSREMQGGLVGYVSFLVDVHCLGVKDGVGSVCSRAEYFRRHSEMREKAALTPMTIQCARKLVEGAVAYAAEADISPHPDYEHLRLIFGDADASACTSEFAYGHEGKPFFTAGPFDSVHRCAEMNGFHFLVGGMNLVSGPGGIEEDMDNIGN
jgi:hypothetical protein